MNRVRKRGLPLAAGMLLACATVPPGPSVMVLPGTGRSFDEFRIDDAECLGWAAQRTAIPSDRAATVPAIAGAAIGTALGAAAGVAIGGALGEAGAGAAIGAGAGLLAGSSAGAARGDWEAASLQQRYDGAYLQCMYANGHQIPLAGASLRTPTPPPPPAPVRAPRHIPPPPPGAPPPPPPR